MVHEVVPQQISIKISHIARQFQFSFNKSGDLNYSAHSLYVFCNVQDSLEGVLVATHQEMELYRNQPLAMEKLQLKKESLQNKLINIRGELSQASSVRQLISISNIK